MLALNLQRGQSIEVGPEETANGLIVFLQPDCWDATLPWPHYSKVTRRRGEPEQSTKVASAHPLILNLQKDSSEPF